MKMTGNANVMTDNNLPNFHVVYRTLLLKAIIKPHREPSLIRLFNEVIVNMGKVFYKNRSQKLNKTINTKSNKKSSNTDKITIQKTKSEKPTMRQLKKKDKFKNKRKSLINKIKLSEKEGLIETKRKRREKTAISDLKQLKDALPSLNQLFKLPRNEIKTGIKSFDDNSGNIKVLQKDNRNRRKEFMNRYNSFTSLLNNKDYKINPRDTIEYHIKNTIVED